VSVPERIYLQWHADASALKSLYETTWCDDRINDDDVEYVLASKLAAAEGLLTRVIANVDLWLVMGTHRSCGCRACQDLQQIAVDAAARAAGGGG
jgi:hypothetical protein